MARIESAGAGLAEQEKVLAAAREVELLNQQVAALRSQLGSLQSLLDESKARDEAAKVQLETLGNDLNAALAQVATSAPGAKALASIAVALKEAETAERADDADAFIEANARFHAAWHALVANRRLLRAIALSAGHVRYLRVLTLGSVPARKAALSGMKNILAALKKRDAAVAQRVMGEHLETARKYLRQALDEIEREAREEGAPPAS